MDDENLKDYAIDNKSGTSKTGRLSPRTKPRQNKFESFAPAAANALSKIAQDSIFKP